jgi:uncharacterized protein
MASLVTFQASSPNFESADLEAKQNALFECIRELDRVIVAYSGGTDSAYLAWAANRALGNNAVAVTADSASMPESHKRDAEAFAREAGFHHEYIATNEFDNPDYVKNDKDRCFHCKDELFTQLESYAEKHGYRHIIYGVNQDDLGDYRPGQRAAKMHDVKAPLAEVALTKAEIRVRFHGDLVRIEIARDELPSAMNPEMFARFAEIFKSLGFHFITLDVEGYRQGALNVALAN